LKLVSRKSVFTSFDTRMLKWKSERGRPMANSRFSGGTINRRRQLTQLTRGASRRTKDIPECIFDVEIGKPVRVKKTGVIAKVSSRASWGDYILEGINGFFSGSQLEEV
jgi:hypothetical protein